MRHGRFSLYRRGPVWYVQFYNPQACRYLSSRSTGQTSRSAAVLKVAEWLRAGVPEPARGARPLEQLLDLDTALASGGSTPTASHSYPSDGVFDHRTGSTDSEKLFRPVTRTYRPKTRTLTARKDDGIVHRSSFAFS